MIMLILFLGISLAVFFVHRVILVKYLAPSNVVKRIKPKNEEITVTDTVYMRRGDIEIDTSPLGEIKQVTRYYTENFVLSVVAIFDRPLFLKEDFAITGRYALFLHKGTIDEEYDFAITPTINVKIIGDDESIARVVNELLTRQGDLDALNSILTSEIILITIREETIRGLKKIYNVFSKIQKSKFIEAPHCLNWLTPVILEEIAIHEKALGVKNDARSCSQNGEIEQH